MVERMCVNDSGANVLLSKNVYEKEAVMAAAYWFIDKYTVDIQDTVSDYLVVFLPREGLTFDEHTVKCDMETFLSNTIDEQMRLKLESKTGKIRELIVQHAFKPLDLQKELEQADAR